MSVSTVGDIQNYMPRPKYRLSSSTESFRGQACKVLLKQHYCLNSNPFAPQSPVWLVASVMTQVIDRRPTDFGSAISPGKESVIVAYCQRCWW